MGRDRMTQAQRLEAAVKDSGLSPKWLAGELGVTDSALRRYRDGSRPLPPGLLDEVASILAAHRATLARLIHDLSR